MFPSLLPLFSFSWDKSFSLRFFLNVFGPILWTCILLDSPLQSWPFSLVFAFSAWVDGHTPLTVLPRLSFLLFITTSESTVQNWLERRSFRHCNRPTRLPCCSQSSSLFTSLIIVLTHLHTFAPLVISFAKVDSYKGLTFYVGISRVLYLSFIRSSSYLFLEW